jgi:DNA polymerase-3 subunit alpha
METLREYFIRDIINDHIYDERLRTEISLLEQLDFIWFIKRFVEIFNSSIKHHMYLLRGSAGSSLLLYYLGVNEIDPIKYGIPLSRFINSLRITKPDIDIDLPSHLRDTIINDIVSSNVDSIRMSCNLRNENNEFFESLVREHPTINLIHNSGVIIFSDDQKELIEKNKITPTQIKLTKDDISDLNLKKIDLLSNTALEQLDKIQTKLTIFSKNIKYNFDDKIIYDFIIEDNGCGITYAETPLIQYVIKVLKPTCISELSTCLAIVRPFACKHINKNMTFTSLKDKIIYDDDFITCLTTLLNLEEEHSDHIRRVFKKGTDKTEMDKFIEMLNTSKLEESEKWKIRRALPKLKSYGFCKSHSLSFARLVYMLYFCKYYHTKIFWESTIKSVKGFYNDWVYIRKGLESGLKFKGIKKCDPFYHYVNTGYWLNKEFMSKCYLKINDTTDINNITPKILTIYVDDDNTNDLENNINLNNDDVDNTYIRQIGSSTNDIFASNDVGSGTGVKESYDLDNYYLENDNSVKHLRKENDMPIVDNSGKEEITISCSKECEFRGLVASSTSTYTKYKKYQTIITIGYDNNKFVDLYLNKKRDFSKFKQVIGKGYYVDDVCPHIIITHMKIFL